MTFTRDNWFTDKVIKMAATVDNVKDGDRTVKVNVKTRLNDGNTTLLQAYDVRRYVGLIQCISVIAIAKRSPYNS